MAENEPQRWCSSKPGGNAPARDEAQLSVPLDPAAELQRAMQRPGFAQAWQALEEEYAALATLLQARSEAGLTQLKWASFLSRVMTASPLEAHGRRAVALRYSNLRQYRANSPTAWA